tara:strand:+ start:612 stop:1358 length:747 start_codon:yes stop_codon:yes gene_type:complete
MLAQKNPHPRDNNITFDKEHHIYTIDGDSDYMSVTTWNHCHFSEFDPDKVITNMKSSSRWSKSEYYNMSDDEIKALWKKNADDGTKLHDDIECYYNGDYRENNSIEYKYFLNFAEDNKHLEAYRTEMFVYDTDLKFAGAIDMLFKKKDGTFAIYDWKRTKNISKSGFDKYSHTECINHLPDSNYWHYSLQLNTYKAILEKNYNIKITDLKLVWLHPKNKNYIIIPLPDLSNEINDLFTLRKANLDNNE